MQWSAELALVDWPFQVDETVPEFVAGEGGDGGGDLGDTAWTPGEAGGKSDQHAVMMFYCGEALDGEASEVGDVLGQDRETIRCGGGQDIGVGPSGQSPFGNSGRLDATGSQRLGQGWRVHLVEQDLQVFEAAVSWRCKSIRASISSG